MYRRNLATGRPLRALRARTFVPESRRFDSEANGIFEDEIRLIGQMCPRPFTWRVARLALAELAVWWCVSN